MMIAFAVNSAGDCVAGTYGWNVERVPGCAGGGTAVAIAGILTWGFLLQSGPLCESADQTVGPAAEAPADTRTGFRTHDEPAVGVPPLPQRARGRRRQDHFLPGAGGAVSPECGANPQGPRVFRRVRRAGRRL